jgi:hypothetical protein
LEIGIGFEAGIVRGVTGSRPTAKPPASSAVSVLNVLTLLMPLHGPLAFLLINAQRHCFLLIPVVTRAGLALSVEACSVWPRRVCKHGIHKQIE